MHLEKTAVPYVFKSISGIFYYRRYSKSHGGLIYKSLRTNKISVARERAKNLDQLFLDKGIKKKIRVLVKDVWAEFLGLKKNTKALSTYLSMEVQGRLHLMPFFGDMHLDSINETTWEEFVARSRSLTPKRKLFNDRKYFSMLMVYAHKKGIIHRIPKFSDHDPEVKAGKALTKAEIKRLLKTAKFISVRKDGRYNAYLFNNTLGDLRLMILMGVTMAMRRSEINRLTWDRVDLVKKRIHLRAEDTKIRKARTMAMSKQVQLMLWFRSRCVKTKGFVFSSRFKPNTPWADFRKSWNKVKLAANVKCRFHDLRHTFLTYAFRNKNLNPMLVCHYAGLSIEEAQRIYLHFNEDDTHTVTSNFNAIGEKNGEKND